MEYMYHKSPEIYVFLFVINSIAATVQKFEVCTISLTFLKEVS